MPGWLRLLSCRVWPLLSEWRLELLPKGVDGVLLTAELRVLSGGVGTWVLPPEQCLLFCSPGSVLCRDAPAVLSQPERRGSELLPPGL